jgi:hypothetical protein
MNQRCLPINQSLVIIWQAYFYSFLNKFSAQDLHARITIRLDLAAPEKESNFSFLLSVIIIWSV